MRSGSLVLFFAAAFGALKGADSETDTQAETNVFSLRGAQDHTDPDQKDNKTHSGTGGELVLQEEPLHPDLARKGPGFYPTDSGAAYFLMRHFEAIWRRENNTTQARRLAEEGAVFSYREATRTEDVEELEELKEELEQALDETNEMNEILENAADAALHRHHENRTSDKDPKLESLRLAVIKALRLLKKLLKLMERLKTPMLVNLLESKLDELAISIKNTKKALMEMVDQKEAFARTHVDNAQKKLEEINIATLNHKTHKPAKAVKELVASPKKMKDALIASMETVMKEIRTQAAQDPQTQPNYAKAKELALTVKIMILEFEDYLLKLRELNKGHTDALNQATLELDYARAAIAGLPQLIEILEIIGDAIDVIIV